MKAGIVSNSIYVMGVDPGFTSGVTIIGVPYLSMYGNSPYHRSYFEMFEVSGNYASQALEIVDATREFFPLALVVESFYPAKPITSEEYLSPVHVGDRIAFCVETHYVLCPFFWQTPSQAMETAPDSRLKLWNLYKPGPDHMKDSTRHVVTFLRRCREDTQLRDSAWGPAQARTRPAKRGSRRSPRRLYLTYGRANGRQTTEMLHTDKTDQAHRLLRSYAHTPGQQQQVDETYVDILADTDNEDTAIMHLVGLILDGIRFGNWFWNMPPNAQTVRCPEHGHSHAYGESRSPRKGQY